jgi:D-cysteine desulfhydrase
VKEGLKCYFVIEERVPGSCNPRAGDNNFMPHLLGVEAITVAPGGSDMAALMQAAENRCARRAACPTLSPGGGSNALGALGYVACEQELEEQLFDLGLRIDRVVVGSGSSGTHGRLLAGFT